jgi:hypothetical protein
VIDPEQAGTTPGAASFLVGRNEGVGARIAASAPDRGHSICSGASCAVPDFENAPREKSSTAREADEHAEQRLVDALVVPVVDRRERTARVLAALGVDAKLEKRNGTAREPDQSRAISIGSKAP